jgi:hypothetical protein
MDKRRKSSSGHYFYTLEFNAQTQAGFFGLVRRTISMPRLMLSERITFVLKASIPKKPVKCSRSIRMGVQVGPVWAEQTVDVSFHREFLTPLRGVRGGSCAFVELSMLRVLFVHPLGLQIHFRLFADY